jgi:hypothetical protein
MKENHGRDDEKPEEHSERGEKAKGPQNHGPARRGPWKAIFCGFMRLDAAVLNVVVSPHASEAVTKAQGRPE